MPDTPTAARRSRHCPSPKGSLIYTPIEDQLEFYLSAGRGFHSADLRGVNQDTSVDLGLPHTPLLAKQEGQEVGVRATPMPNLAFTFAYYNLWQQSETIIDPDVGQDTAGPPSRRYGYEINVTYQINRYLEFYGSYSGDHTHFTHPFDDGTGHLGEYITDAPLATGALALYLTNLGPWSGGIELSLSRQLSAVLRDPASILPSEHDFPGYTTCANSPTAGALGQVDGKGFGEWNLDAHYAFSRVGAPLSASIIFSTHMPPRRSSGMSIGCKTRSAPTRTDGPTSTNILWNRSWRDLRWPKSSDWNTAQPQRHSLGPLGVLYRTVATAIG